MPDQSTLRKIQGLSSLIGNTPLLQIHFNYWGTERIIYAKAEHLNMTGSIKDRMAYYILQQAYASNVFHEGDHIIEATSGNTGISFSAIGRALGHPVTIYMPDWMSRERINLIRSFGADIQLISREEGGFIGSIEKAENHAREQGNAFLPRQFSNNDNSQAHYRTTGPEIWWQLRFRGLKPDAFIAGVGTGGSVMGVGTFLKEQNSTTRVHPLEPVNSPTLSTGYKVGQHRIQGISDDFIPAIVDLEKLDDVIAVDDGDAIIMAQKLARELGIGVGISSGANFLGALKVQNQIGKDAVVVTLFPDDNKKYLSTNIIADEPVKEGFLSSDVQLRSFRALKRVCHTCCDPSDCVEARFKEPDVAVPLPFCPRRYQKVQ